MQRALLTHSEYKRVSQKEDFTQFYGTYTALYAA